MDSVSGANCAHLLDLSQLLYAMEFMQQRTHTPLHTVLVYAVYTHLHGLYIDIVARYAADDFDLFGVTGTQHWRCPPTWPLWNVTDHDVTFSARCRSNRHCYTCMLNNITYHHGDKM